MAEVNLIKRDEVSRKVVQHWLDTLTPEELLRKRVPSWERMRNYEMEHELEEVFGGAWVVSEWCPFNGVYCEWVDHCPREVLENNTLSEYIQSKIRQRFPDG